MMSTLKNRVETLESMLLDERDEDTETAVVIRMISGRTGGSANLDSAIVGMAHYGSGLILPRKSAEPMNDLVARAVAAARVSPRGIPVLLATYGARDCA